MKKIWYITLSISLVLLSFFYTDKTIEILRNNDPLMKKIKKTANTKEINAKNATVLDNTIKPGLNGSKINYEKSFQKMKKYGKYNADLMVFDEVEPAVSLGDTYNKFVVSGNEENNNIALIFRVERDDNVDKILEILEDHRTNATFFVDGLWLENNQEKVVEMSEVDMEIELLNYDSNYQKKYFESALHISETLTGKENKYCYAEYERKQVLNLCNRLNLHTVIPNIITTENPFKDIKEKLANGSMISMPLGSTVIHQLPTIIDYIKQRGYNLVTLDKLLSEENTVN